MILDSYTIYISRHRLGTVLLLSFNTNTRYLYIISNQNTQIYVIYIYLCFGCLLLSINTMYILKRDYFTQGVIWTILHNKAPCQLLPEY